MDIITAESFDFKTNSALLVGQTGSGKSYLIHEYINRLEQSYGPDELKYVLFDLKHVEFSREYVGNRRNYSKDYLLFDVVFDIQLGLDRLHWLAKLAEDRVESGEIKPQIFIYIEECDMAVSDQKRFDMSVIKINKRAKAANMKLIYSTSRIGSATISKYLLNSFETVIAGQLISGNHSYLGIPEPRELGQYEFLSVNR